MKAATGAVTAFPALSVTDRYVLKGLRLQESSVMPPGKAMWCRGREVLGIVSLEAIARVTRIPRGADTVCVARADYQRVKDWID